MVTPVGSLRTPMCPWPMTSRTSTMTLAPRDSNPKHLKTVSVISTLRRLRTPTLPLGPQARSSIGACLLWQRTTHRCAFLSRRAHRRSMRRRTLAGSRRQDLRSRHGITRRANPEPQQIIRIRIRPRPRIRKRVAQHIDVARPVHGQAVQRKPGEPSSGPVRPWRDRRPWAMRAPQRSSTVAQRNWLNPGSCRSTVDSWNLLPCTDIYWKRSFWVAPVEVFLPERLSTGEANSP
jgi:hypothetical protein